MKNSQRFILLQTNCYLFSIWHVLFIRIWPQIRSPLVQGEYQNTNSKLLQWHGGLHGLWVGERNRDAPNPVCTGTNSKRSAGTHIQTMHLSTICTCSVLVREFRNIRSYSGQLKIRQPPLLQVLNTHSATSKSKLPNFSVHLKFRTHGW